MLQIFQKIKNFFEKFKKKKGPSIPITLQDVDYILRNKVLPAFRELENHKLELQLELQKVKPRRFLHIIVSVKMFKDEVIRLVEETYKEISKLKKIEKKEEKIKEIKKIKKRILKKFKKEKEKLSKDFVKFLEAELYEE